jgi:hypothetical protein
MRQPMRIAVQVAGSALLALLAACGGGSDLSFGPTPTATITATPTAVSTATPTATPGAQSVAGQIVVDGQVRGGSGDGLKPLPPESLPPVPSGFDRGLANADWVLDDGSARGTTSDDGRFSIAGVAPGAHVVHVTKTVEGNLLAVDLPIVVGDDGSADVVAEVTWGLVRTTSTYTVGGAAARAVFAPGGTHAITVGTRLVEIGGAGRTFRDGDGDGRFDPVGCDAALASCDGAGGCDADHVCACVPSCPACDDCPLRACIPAAAVGRPTCLPGGVCKAQPYACAPDRTCAVPGDTCACVSSCPGCAGCGGFACVSSCAPVTVIAVQVGGPDRLVIGQPGSASASVMLSDGSAIDVTAVASWASSAPTVAAIDGFGRLAAASAGTVEITASLADLVSAPLSLQVVDRPELRRILLQNASCYYPIAYPEDGTVATPAPPVMPGYLPAPSCEQVLRIGATLQLVALGEFDGGYYQDVSAEVTWQVSPPEVGTIDQSVFTAVAAGDGEITAALAGITSDPLSIRVVTAPTIVALSIYPLDRAYPALEGGPIQPDGAPLPCYDCGYAFTLLQGDAVRFGATAHYDTGEWEDVTARVVWRSSDPAVAPIDATGLLTAAGAGDASIDATLATVTSAAAAVRVVDHATLQSLYAYQDGQDRVIAIGAQLVFHAVGAYDVGFSRDVTAQVTWRSSDERVGGFDGAGVFTGRGAGMVMVSAVLDGIESAPIAIEVFATSELSYCDPTNVNRATWADDFNRVTLESDCAAYTAPAVVALRFSVTETQRPGGVFDPCLDLYAYRGDTLVRVIRQQGCGDPFVAPTAANRDDAVLKYQLTAFWDLKDEQGNVVPPGSYTITGRFYLYYDPVVKLSVRVDPPAPAN